MAPAFNTNYSVTDLSLNATNINATTDSHAVDPAAMSALSPLFIALSTIGLVLAAALSGVIVTRLLKDTHATRAHRAKKHAVRPLVLRSGSSKVEFAPRSHGRKPLLLPTMSTVRSSRAKASLAGKFLGRWGAAHAQQVRASSDSTRFDLRASSWRCGQAGKDDVECARSPTLVGEEDEEKAKSTPSAEWTPGQLYKIPISHEVPVSALAPAVPVLAAKSKKLFGLGISAEHLAAPEPAYSPRDARSVDVVNVEGLPPVARSFTFLPFLPADAASPINGLVAVPAIVVHNCSRPASAVMDTADADDRLRVPSAPSISSVEEEELE